MSSGAAIIIGAFTALLGIVITAVCVIAYLDLTRTEPHVEAADRSRQLDQMLDEPIGRNFDKRA